MLDYCMTGYTSLSKYNLVLCTLLRISTGPMVACIVVCAGLSVEVAFRLVEVLLLSLMHVQHSSIACF